jgi:opacity protein-like surface antigen
MNRLLGAAPGAALALALSAAAAEAQVIPRPVRFAVGGGVSAPAGDIKDFVDPGFNLMAALDVGVPLVPVGLRLDGNWSQFKGKGEAAGTDLRVLYGTANVTLNLLPIPVLKPYVLAGVGAYDTKVTDTGDDGDAPTRVGYNAGVGLRFDLLGLGAFAEARYHHVPEKDDFIKTQFLPITVGIRF